MEIKILNTIGDAFADEGKAILKKIGDVTYAQMDQSALPEVIDGYDAALIGLGLNFDKPVLGAAKKLKVIATATTGLDHIDVSYAKEKGIEVLSLRGEDAFLDTITGTAELAWGLLIDLVRRVPAAFDSVKKYEWKRDNFKGISLRGKTLGIVGLGRLGKMTARYGKAFGMKVVYADPTQDPHAFPDYEKVTFDELLAQSDCVSIHVHLLPETENMFDTAAFKRMKAGAYLVNTARGKIVDEKAVFIALQGGRLAGYATDVLADELSFETSGFKRHPLVEYAKTHDNCLVVPHIGGMTTDSREATDVFMAEKLARFLAARA